MNELQINLLAAIVVGGATGALAWFAYRSGKTDASVEFMISYILSISDRDLTALDLLDNLHAKGIMAAGFANIYPALNRLEKKGLISSYMQDGRKYFVTRQIAEQSP